MSEYSQGAMSKFFSYISKQKKILSLVLLFSIVSGIFLFVPAKASADLAWYCFLSPASMSLCLTAKTASGAAKFTIELSDVVKALMDNLDAINAGVKQITGGVNAIEDIPRVLIVYAAWLMSIASYYVALGASELFKYVLDQLIRDPANLWSITRASGAGIAFLTSWNIVKTWANMLIVLGLIGVAVATILRIQEYEAKKLLVPILAVALLINFSIVFVGLMVDMSNFMMKTLTVGGDRETSIVGKINYAWDNTARGFPIKTWQQAMSFFGINLIFDAMYLMVAFFLIYFCALLIERYILLAVLFVLSPLAFVLRVLPFQKAHEIWNKWWQNFLKWIFAGIAAAFFLRLSVDVFISYTWPVIDPSGLNQTDVGAMMSAILPTLAHIGIVIVFLFIGIRIAKKSGGPFADIVMSAAKALGAIIVGTIMAVITGGASLTMSGAGAALKASGATDTAKNAKNSVTDSLKLGGLQLGESFGAFAAGTTATARQKIMTERLKEPTERLSNIQDNRAGNTELARVVTSGRTPEERAAATNLLKERGWLSSIPQANRRVAMDNAMAHDSKLKLSDFTKSDYRFAEFDDNALARIQLANPGFNQAQARQTAILQQLETNLSKMSGKERINIDISHLTPELITSRNFNANMVRDFKVADRAHIDTLKVNPAAPPALLAAATAIETALNAAIAAALAGDNPNRAEANRLRNIKNEIAALP